ncbi:MAG TPA: hypothetical protein VF572_04950 [Candidatus Saccharimonadales bacterium]|jgi:hypothetical protein
MSRNFIRYTQGEPLRQLSGALIDEFNVDGEGDGSPADPVELRYPLETLDMEQDLDKRPMALRIMGRTEVSRVYPNMGNLSERAIQTAIDSDEDMSDGYPIRFDEVSFDEHSDGSSHLTLRLSPESLDDVLADSDGICDVLNALAKRYRMNPRKRWNHTFEPDLTVAYFPAPDSTEELRTQHRLKAKASEIVKDEVGDGLEADLGPLRIVPFGDLLG